MKKSQSPLSNAKLYFLYKLLNIIIFYNYKMKITRCNGICNTKDVDKNTALNLQVHVAT